MTESLAQHDGQLRHPEVSHERSDVSFRSIMIVLGAIACVAVVIHVVVWRFFDTIREEQARVKKSPYPLAPEPSSALPREPRLEQIDRLAGIETLNVYQRETELLKVLDHYGPTREEGFIHIPIDRAMRLLENKLPARAESSAEQRRRSGGLIDAGEPNSGRLFRGRSR